MNRPFLIGSRIYLRGVEVSDADGAYLRWVNDAETVRFLDAGRFPTTRAALEAHIRRAGRESGSLFLAIVERDGDRHIGNIKLGPIDWTHRVASIGILVGERDCRGRGYGREAVALVVRHAFEQLGLHKVTAGAHGDHQASLDLFAAEGFAVEGRQRAHLFREGEYRDKVLMGLLRDDYFARETRP